MNHSYFMKVAWKPRLLAVLTVLMLVSTAKAEENNPFEFTYDAVVHIDGLIYAVTTPDNGPGVGMLICTVPGGPTQNAKTRGGYIYSFPELLVWNSNRDQIKSYEDAKKLGVEHIWETYIQPMIDHPGGLHPPLIGEGMVARSRGAGSPTKMEMGKIRAATRSVVEENKDYTFELKCIGNYAFKDCDWLTELEIPNSVTQIWPGAFYQCENLTTFTIPESVEAIGSGAFYKCSSLQSVTIPNSVTYLGSGAYMHSGVTSATIGSGVTKMEEDMFYFSNVSSLTLSNNLTAIGADAFRGCKIKNLTIPTGVKTIGNAAFSQNEIASVSLPNTLETIGEYAFASNKLQSITIPQKVTTIEKGTFYNNELQSVSILGKITAIGKDAFSENTGITSFGISDLASWCDMNAEWYRPNSNKDAKCNLYLNGNEVTDLVIPDGVTTIGKYTFMCLSGLTSLTIPDGVTSIQDGAFLECYGLTKIVLPKSLTSIGSFVFQNCKNITSITSLMTEPFEFNPSSGTFHFSISNNAILYVPAGSKSLYEKTEGWAEFANIVEMEGETTEDIITFADQEVKTICVANWDTNGDGELSKTEAANVTSLGMVFKNNTEIISFDELQYFTGLTTINDYAFYKCSGLTSVTIPNGITSIGDVAFRSCSSLNCMTIPYGVTSIGVSAFEGCSNLTFVTIPDGVTFIGKLAFSWCNSLTSVNIPDGVTSIGDGTFYNCSGLTSINIPDGVTSMGERVFQNCSGLTSVIIPNGVTTIGNGIFEGCGSLTSVTIPDDVTSIGESAFSGCNSLPSVIIPSSVTEIGSFAFYWCNSLTSVNIPDGVTFIGESAFSGCSSLPSVIIPSSVTEIGSSAFNYCSKLKSVTSMIKVPIGIDDNCFQLWTSSTLHVPYGTKSLYEKAVGWKKFTNIVETGDEESDLKDGDTFTAKTEGGNVLTFEVLSAANKTCEVVRKEYEGNTFVTLASRDVVIPSEVNGFKVVSIGYEALIAELTSLTIPKSLTSIKAGAFENYDRKAKIGEIRITDLTAFCNIKLSDPFPSGFSLHLNGEEVTMLTIPEGISYVGEDTWDYSSPFSGCISLTSVEIPNGVTSIGYGAFERCTNLTSISIPKTLTSIGYGAFDGCTNVTSFTSYVEQPSDIQKLLCDFGEFCANATLYVPKGSKEAYEAANGWKDFKEIVEVTFGDANADGEVSQDDVELVKEYILTGKADGLNFNNADTNGNKQLNAADIVKILNIIKSKKATGGLEDIDQEAMERQNPYDDEDGHVD